MNNIQQIYEMLNWENPSEVQKNGVVLAKKVKNLSLLIMPPTHPSVWETCASILSNKSDEELQPYLPELFDWINDVNWPGGFIILNRLIQFSGKELKEPFIQCVTQIFQRKNEDDDRWLYFLSTLLENEDLKRQLPEDIIKTLQKHRNQWENWEN